MIECLGEDLRGFPIRFSTNFLNAFVSFRFHLQKITFLLAQNFGSFSRTLGPKPFRNLLPLADHSLVNPLAHALVVVDSFEPDIQQLDSEVGQFLGRFFENLRFHLRTAHGNRVKHTHVPRRIQQG